MARFQEDVNTSNNLYNLITVGGETLPPPTKMLNTYGNAEQLQFLKNTHAKEPPFITPHKIAALEESSILSIKEKVELVELFLGFRFLTELASNISYGRQRKDGLSYPSMSDIKQIQTFVDDLGLESSISKKRSKRSNRYVHQVNVFSNKAIRSYFTKFEKKISPLEIGILYGYHPKAVLAFCGYIESSVPPKPKSAYQFYNSIIYPRDYYDEVDSYHKYKWSRLTDLAPNLINQAESLFSYQKQ